MNRRSIVFFACALGASVAAPALRPTSRAAEKLAQVNLEAQIPKEFEGWHVDTSIVPVLPNPEVQAGLDKIYTQVLARTYVRADGLRVMFTIAYGADQATDATSVHRPEFCYSAQGFSVRDQGEGRVDLNGRPLRVRHLVGRLGPRVEPITYWVTLNETAILPGAERKIQQIKMGLSGLIPDGMLVRVSTQDRGSGDVYQVHRDFIASLSRVISPDIRKRYFGS